MTHKFEEQLEYLNTLFDDQIIDLSDVAGELAEEFPSLTDSERKAITSMWWKKMKENGMNTDWLEADNLFEMQFREEKEQ